MNTGSDHVVRSRVLTRLKREPHRTRKFPLATGTAGSCGGVEVQIALVGSQKNAGPPYATSFLRGEVLESLARNEEALRWYEVARQDYSGELYVAAIARARARLGAARR